MRPCHQVEIVTPKKVRLNGLWYGSYAPKRVIVFVHGYGGSVFSRTTLVEQLARQGTAVLAFSNRGHDLVSGMSTTAGKSRHAGSAHEIFGECADDIDGAVRFARQFQVPVYLMGHSTGCQKSIYWASKRGRGANGIVLLAPISDYESATTLNGKAKVNRALAHAKKLIKNGKKDELIPKSIWGGYLLTDAQRFVSLYSGNSTEEMFTYWVPEKKPGLLSRVRIPICTVLAEGDEFVGAPATSMASWFTKHTYTGEVSIVPKVGHFFKGAEKEVARIIRRFMKESRS